MLIDAHCHLSEVFGKPASALIAEMDAASVDMAIVFAGLGERGENEFVANAAAQFPDRFIPFFSFDPRYEEEGVLELEKYIAEKGMRGIKVGHRHANARYMYPMMEEAQRLGVPVAIHSDHGIRNHPYIIGELASSYPKVNVIILHMGGGTSFDTELLSIKVAERNKNVYLETSYSNPYAVKMAVKKIGPHRILAGTDAANGGYETRFERPGQYQELMLDTVRLIGLPSSEEDLILGGNAARLLGVETE